MNIRYLMFWLDVGQKKGTHNPYACLLYSFCIMGYSALASSLNKVDKFCCAFSELRCTSS